MSRPLDGVIVLDFTRVYSGPYTTLLLADMGAQVIKVEHPAHGDDSRAFGPFIAGTSGYFETLNRGKRSIAVDYRHADGQALLRRLVPQVDVVVENFRPGQMARYGLGYDDLKALHPALVYVSISGYGQFGPDAHLGCYDVVAQAVSGLMSLTGLPELPLKTGPAIADAITGLTAAVGLLGALYQRSRTEQGAFVDVAMVDSVFAVLENALAEYSVSNQRPTRQGNSDSALAPFDAFATREGWLVIGVGNDRLWQALATLVDPALLDDARFETNAGRVQHYGALRPTLAAWCSARTTQDTLTLLHAAGVPSGAVRSIDELTTDAHLEARGMLQRLTLAADETLLVPGSPLHISDSERPPAQRAPHLGEHTGAILMQMASMKADEMAMLAARGIASGLNQSNASTLQARLC
ncbi:MAG: CoA transferase [Chloroflexota bacterium]|nr:CoA transferase [Chloroflexota bacterium]